MTVESVTEAHEQLRADQDLKNAIDLLHVAKEGIEPEHTPCLSAWGRRGDPAFIASINRAISRVEAELIFDRYETRQADPDEYHELRRAMDILQGKFSILRFGDGTFRPYGKFDPTEGQITEEVARALTVIEREVMAPRAEIMGDI